MYRIATPVLTSEQYNFLQTRVRLLMAAFDKAYRLAMIDEPFRRQFGLLDWEEELIQADPGIRHASPLSRLDAFFVTDTGTLLFTEFNAEVPAAAAYNDMLTGHSGQHQFCANFPVTMNYAPYRRE